MKLPVLDSVRPAASQSLRVRFRPESIDRAVESWGEELKGPSDWGHACHYFDAGEETVRWIFVLDVLNHCFWPDPGEPVWTVEYRGERYSGYWGLAASLKKAMESGIPLTSAAYLSEISQDVLREIFAGEGEIPMLDERLHNLREAGRELLSRWRGDVVNLVESSRGSAVQTVMEVVSSFPSFRDEALYRGNRVCLWKRAQIFASDLYHAFDGSHWGSFHDIAELTAFADYKLPQVLRALRVISYAPELAEKIDKLEMFENGSEEEVEIRAMTIFAVEAFKESFRRVGRSVTSAEIDNWLWQLGQLEPFRQKPYHRCRTIYY